MPGKIKSFLPAYGLITALIYLLLFSHSSFAQEYSPLDSIKTGSKYKIILFDDTEIMGVIVKNDSDNVVVESISGQRTIRKDDIFTISKNLTPSYYRFMFSLAGGIVAPGGEFPYGDERRFSPSVSFQLNSAFVVSSNKAFRIDIGYSRIKKKSSYQEISYSGGDANLISFKCDFLIGELKPASFFTAYALVGAGLHYTFVPAYTETYTGKYYGTDSTYTHTYSYEQEQKFNFLFAVGGGAGIKLNKYLSIFAEIQYNSVSYRNEFFFFPFSSGYIPIRLGLTYHMF